MKNLYWKFINAGFKFFDKRRNWITYDELDEQCACLETENKDLREELEMYEDNSR